jgi:hypothetical protein
MFDHISCGGTMLAAQVLGRFTARSGTAAVSTSDSSYHLRCCVPVALLAFAAIPTGCWQATEAVVRSKKPEKAWRKRMSLRTYWLVALSPAPCKSPPSLSHFRREFGATPPALLKKFLTVSVLCSRFFRDQEQVGKGVTGAGKCPLCSRPSGRTAMMWSNRCSLS